MKKKFLLLILMVCLLPGVVFGAYKFIPGSHILEDIGSTSKAWLGVYAKYFHIQEGGSIVVEGSSDDAYETTIAFSNPTADRTITFPDATGTVLTTGSSVTVAQGGTGLASYTVGDLLYASGTTTLAKLAAGTAYQGLQMNSGATAPAWASSEAVLATGTIALNADGNTTLFTVPTGRRAILTKFILIAGADAGSTDITIGQAGALTDFLNTQKTDNLNAANDVGIFMPVPNATAPGIKSYAASTVIKAAVANHAGGATNTFYLFGIVY